MFDGNSDRRRNRVNGFFVTVLIVAALYFGREIFIPLALAGLVAFLLAPVATRLEHWGVQRTIAGLLVIGLSFASICAVGWVVLGQVYNLAVELPQYQQNVTKKIDTLHLHSAGRLTSTVQMLTNVSKQISSVNAEEPVPTSTVGTVRHRRTAGTPTSLSSDAARKAGEPVPVRVEEPEISLVSLAAEEIQPLIHPLTTAFVVIIFVIFMLLARDDLRDRAVRLIGSSRIHITTVAMTDAGARVSRYLLMQFFVNVTYGGIIGFALWGIGVPHPLLWAVTTALLRFIPYIGILAAGAGPVLVALAVSPNWATVAWTFGLYVVMELLSANAIEPFLYGSSTGVSALAILVAAIFWTWLWGIAGLLLSTPLTVCLIVIGRHVPRLEFIGVMFGEESVLDPPQRLYQRILASDSQDASRLINDELKNRSREAVYDNVLIPALSFIEEARHSEELEPDRAEHALHRIEELVEEQWTAPAPVNTADMREQIVCVAVRDFADEISCQLLVHVVTETYRVQVLAAELLSADVIAAISATRPRVICVVGIPPQAIRHVRLRCHQLRLRFPETIVVACVLSTSVTCPIFAVEFRLKMRTMLSARCSRLRNTWSNLPTQGTRKRLLYHYPRWWSKRWRSIKMLPLLMRQRMTSSIRLRVVLRKPSKLL